MPLRVQPRIDLTLELQEVAERLRAATKAQRTNIRVLTTNDSNYPVLAEALAKGAFSLTGGMSKLGYQGGDIHNAPTVRHMRSTGKTIIQRDTAVDPPQVPIAREFGGQAGQMLGPLHFEGAFCGFIAVHGDGEPRDWSAEDQAALQVAVSEAEAVLSKASWFERPEPAQHLLAVLSEPAAGREDEYNAWYSGQHIDETLETPGWVAARRYVLSDAQLDANVPSHRYLALYELSTASAAEALEALRGRSDAISPSDLIAPNDIAGVFTPITDRIEPR